MQNLTRIVLGLVLIGGLAGGIARAADAGSRRGDAHMYQEKPKEKRVSGSGYDVTPLSRDRVAELAEKLTVEQFRVTQRAGTEAPFCGTLLDNKKEGVYTCVVCRLPLFTSEHKFTSGTGWPSFFSTFDPAHVTETRDASHGMERTEISCGRCDAHLGHVFEDGPAPTGLRYCLNSAALDFIEKGRPLPPKAGEELPAQTAYFAGGCFWGVEYAFSRVPGVLDAESGYQNGGVDDPSYREVCSDRTGHAEAVKVVFDPERVSYRQLVRFFFLLHDPTQLNRQGPDIGSQYRSAVFVADEEQARIAREVRDEVARSGAFKGREIVTEIDKAGRFWPAEEYHQDYIDRTGRACHVNIPAALDAIGAETEQP